MRSRIGSGLDARPNPPRGAWGLREVAHRLLSDAWPVSQNATPVVTGGTVTVRDGYQIHKFSASDTLEVMDAPVTAEVLVVAGGGSGGGDIGGGGGAGGVLYKAVHTLPPGSHPVTVGAGAPKSGGYANGTNGEDSSLADLLAVGGGAGAVGSSGTGFDGGSGGGAGGFADGAAGGSGTAGQGNDGGASAPTTSWSNSGSGGGGGAGAAGEDGAFDDPGVGGDGLSFDIGGASKYYGGGGGGYAHGGGSAAGGQGGGGQGGGTDATDGTGGGGGGGSSSGGAGGAGGSGVVIVRYQMPALSPYDQLILNDSPLAYWRMDDEDDTARDIVGGYDGSYYGAPVEASPFVAGSQGAKEFDGVDDYVDISSISGNLDTNALSLEAWIRPDSDGSIGEVIIGGGTSSGDNLFHLALLGTNGLRLYSNYSSGNVLEWLGYTVGEWMHVVVTRDGTAAILYVDGVEVDTGTWIDSLSDASYRYFIGQEEDPGNVPSQWFPGGVDCVAIYNTILTPAQVGEHHSQGAP